VTDYHFSFQLLFSCRQLIFSEPKIIASPACGEDGILYIVMTHDYCKSGRLQLHLEKLNMTVSAVERNNPSYLQWCLNMSYEVETVSVSSLILILFLQFILQCSQYHRLYSVNVVIIDWFKFNSESVQATGLNLWQLKKMLFLWWLFLKWNIGYMTLKGPEDFVI
jgi:hypothetical protein